MSFSACISCPVSSRLSTRMFALRSPAATVSATPTALASGRTMLREMKKANRPPSSTVSAVSSSRRLKLFAFAASMAWLMSSMARRSMASSSSTRFS
ncbi:hypothetical protein D3C86_1269450 [compost metagenome]